MGYWYCHTTNASKRDAAVDKKSRRHSISEMRGEANAVPPPVDGLTFKGMVKVTICLHIHVQTQCQ